MAINKDLPFVTALVFNFVIFCMCLRHPNSYGMVEILLILMANCVWAIESKCRHFAKTQEVEVLLKEERQKTTRRLLRDM